MTEDLAVDRTENRSERIEEEERSFGFSLFCVFVGGCALSGRDLTGGWMGSVWEKSVEKITIFFV